LSAALDIVVVRERIDPQELKRLVTRFFGDMVKFVVDIERGVAAIGGELHADAEARLLALESRQEDLWGGNYKPGLGPERCIEFTALVNIRPSQGNRAMMIESQAIQARVQALVFRLLGRGEPLE